ncbi:integrating conjugative element protein [Citrobacter portucalensis]|uniref:integrating conjugative element protein n=1 Tax=Citrobacter portucalensis TaxID=1639133 RepID=UPI00226B5EB5|nr:integrating conjugative element protein [Citrobacter portucalensis]MCX8984258.1 integrating conjugative element protein [Citrobacter portucalensis]
MKITFPALPLLLAGVIFQAAAELTVIADLGGEPTAPLYEAIQPDNAPSPLPMLSIPGSFTAQDTLPVISPHLGPGPLVARSLSLPGFSPLFLIGADPLSVRWLEQHKKGLLALHATGLIVNVSTPAQLNSLHLQAPDLTMLPASGEDLAQRLQLTTYPVLITETGLTQ